jgi:hypothetical protein
VAHLRVGFFPRCTRDLIDRQGRHYHGLVDIALGGLARIVTTPVGGIGRNRGEGFAVDGNLIKANASWQRGVKGDQWTAPGRYRGRRRSWRRL